MLTQFIKIMKQPISKKLWCIFTPIIMTSSLLHAAGDGWMTDFSAAKEKAAKENKLLLIEFNGSDWCGFCIKLNNQIFKQEVFKQGVKEHFVLVELDYPRNKSKQSDELIQQNAKLKQLYPVRGYPSVILADAKGVPFAQTGYLDLAPETYLKHLQSLLPRRDIIANLIEEASLLEGVKKAEIHMQLLSVIPKRLAHHYPGIREQIPQLDPDDTTGYMAGLKLDTEIKQLDQAIDALYDEKNVSKAPDLIDQFIAERKLSENRLISLKQKKLQIQTSLAKRAGKLDLLQKHVDEYITNNGVSGINKQAALMRKVGPLIIAKRNKDALRVCKEIIAISPKSQYGHKAIKYEKVLLDRINIQSAKDSGKANGAN